MTTAPPPLWDATRIAAETQKYWMLCRTLSKTVDLTDLYVNGTPDDLLPDGLLGLELRSAEPRLNLLRTKNDESCDILVLMVGYSFEPLLQTICAYNPTTTILLVLNRSYGVKDPGKIYGGKVKGWIDTTLRKHAWITQNWFTNHPAIEYAVLRDESAAGIFRVLHDEITRLQAAAADKLCRQPNIVVDITGGKKPMDAGAFLYAAYSGVPISYVNFAQYDPVERRPYGYSCDIGPLENPYEAFRLRDWEELRGHYCEDRFRQACDVLRNMKQDMIAAFRMPSDPRLEQERPPVTDTEVNAALTLLEQLLDFYVAWDAGDYADANTKAQGLARVIPGFVLPTAVTLLGDIWTTIRSHTEGLTQKPQRHSAPPDLKVKLARAYFQIYWNNKFLFAYAEDELARIKRLVAGGEYRAALLRAAGFDEFLLKTRLIRLWREDNLLIKTVTYVGQKRKEEDANVDDALRQRVEDALITHSSGSDMRRCLRGPDGYLSLNLTGTSYCLRPRPAQHLLAYDDQTPFTGEVLTELRNQASHFYLYVDKDLASDAIAVAEANWNDMWRPRWSNVSEYGALPDRSHAAVGAMPWADVVQRCKLTFLPQLSRSSPR